MGWFRVVDERVHYHGVERKAFAEWLSTRDGAEMVNEVAADIRFSLLGRARAARHSLWRDLKSAAASPDAASAFEAAAAAHARAVADLAYARELPCVVAGLRRVVLVPRVLAAGRARASIVAELGACPAFTALHANMRTFLLEQTLRELDLAVCQANPSSRRAVAAANGWICVGVDTAYEWVDPLWSGPGWEGHYAVYERPHGMSRADYKVVERAVESLQSGIRAFSRQRRHQVAHAAIN